MRILAAILGLTIGIVGLGIDYWVIMPSITSVSATNPVARSYPDAFINFWTFFTHLTNLGLVLVYLAGITGWRGLAWFSKPYTQALMAGYILLVMLYYHFMLAPLYVFEGPLLIATILLHYVAPIYYLAWWVLFTPHGNLRFADVPAMLIPGVIYVAWALGRGALVGEYPYDILDAGKNGYMAVATGVLLLVAAVTVFCALVIIADRLLARRSSPA
jgi:hypothetical protein